MTRMRRVAAWVGVALVGGMGVVGRVPASTAQVGSTHLEVFAAEGPFEKDIDVAKPGFPTAGDYAVESQPLLEPSDGARIGRSLSHVQIVRQVAEGQDVEVVLSSTLRLSDGDLVVQGGLRFSELFGGASLPVVGGTGAYAGARGTASFTAATVADTDGFVVSIDISMV